MDDKLQAKKTYYQQFLDYTEQQILENYPPVSQTSKNYSSNQRIMNLNKRF
ncbi:hypothetical protein ACSHG9_002039 [Enterococcus hirae]